MRSYLVTLSLLGSLNYAHATTQFVGVTGVSTFVYDDTKKTNLDVYGGWSSDCTNDANDEYSTCNSCTDQTGVVACNKVSIYPGLYFKIGIKTDSSDVLTNSTQVVMYNEENQIDLDISQDKLSANQTVYLIGKWSDVCSAIEGTSSSCQFQGHKVFTVGFDKDGDGKAETNEFISVDMHVQWIDSSTPAVLPAPVTDADGNKSCAGDTNGICDFEVKKGDEKIYVKDFLPSNRYPETSFGADTDFKKVVIFYEPDGTTVGSGSPNSEITTTSNGDEITISKSSVGDLQNGTTYSLRLANMDMAGNIFNFSSIIQTEQPELVSGILKKDKCFIATAAYGSLFDSKVQDLRKFRDRVLLTNRVGALFVKWYYENSPPLAQWISDKEQVRAFVRVILWPVWGFAYLILYMPWGFAGLLILSVIAILFFKKRKSAYAARI